MKRLALAASLVVGIGVSVVIACTPTAAQDPADKPASDSKAEKAEKPTRVEKTDAEWQKLLTREQFLVTRKKVTEPAGSGKYAHFKGKGIFACVCCGSELFDARTKFESGTGWPSFYQPIAQTRIATADDFSEPAEVRVEVTCAVCDAHLGHVFSDGPPPTGLRFCINSAALKLVTPPVAAPKAKAKAKTPAKAAAKGKTPAKTDTANPKSKTKSSDGKTPQD